MQPVENIRNNEGYKYNLNPLMSNTLMLVKFVCEQLKEDSNKLLWIDFGLD